MLEAAARHEESEEKSATVRDSKRNGNGRGGGGGGGGLCRCRSEVCRPEQERVRGRRRGEGVLWEDTSRSVIVRRLYLQAGEEG
jgi:hypothetical protein